MKVLLTGSTGFVGKQMTESLVESGYSIRCLVRKGSESRIANREKIEIAFGDVCDPASLRKPLDGIETVINLVGIIREFPRRGITFEKLHVEGTKNLVDEAKKRKIRKFIQMSALGADIHSTAEYHRTKARAEDHLKLSGLRYTIFRPSIIFGPEDKFVNYFAGMIRRAPLIPVIGNGRYLLQPIWVKNVSDAFVKSIDLAESDYQVFEAGGPQKIEFNELLDIIGNVIGKRIRKIHIPPRILTPIVSMMEGFRPFPLTIEQIEMLLQGNTCDEKRFFETFRIVPLTFEEGIQDYLS